MDTLLPADFDGVFRFTNPTDDDFVGMWNSREYTFPAMTTSPIIMPDESPLGIQSIRKKWAKELAEREFFKSEKYQQMRSREVQADGTPRLQSFQTALAYNDDMLGDMIQQCLKPLPTSKHRVRVTQTDTTEEKLHRDEDDKLVTKPVTGGKGMKELAKEFEN